MLCAWQSIFIFEMEAGMHGCISQTRIRLLSAGLCLLLPTQFAAAQPVPFPVANSSFEGSYLALNECANITGVVAPDWADNTCWDTNHPVINYASISVTLWLRQSVTALRWLCE